MSDTFTQLYVQYVFSVKGRQNLLKKEWRDELFRYMSGIVREKGQKSIITNGVEDHVHVLVGIKPTMMIDALVRDIKNNSSNFVNSKGWVNGKFSWQEGYGGFTYARRDIEYLYGYILNQEQHHAKKTFKKEYTDLLSEFEIPYEEKYLFEWYHE